MWFVIGLGSALGLVGLLVLAYRRQAREPEQPWHAPIDF